MSNEREKGRDGLGKEKSGTQKTEAGEPGVQGHPEVHEGNDEHQVCGVNLLSQYLGDVAKRIKKPRSS